MQYDNDQLKKISQESLPFFMKAGERKTITGVTGDFVHVYQGEKLTVSIDNSSAVPLSAGQQTRVKRVFSEKSRLVVTNTTSFDQWVTLIVGVGQFIDNKVGGTIYSISGILGSNGESQADDRIKEAVNLAITDANPFNYLKAEVIKTETLAQSGLAPFTTSGADAFYTDDGVNFYWCSMNDRIYHRNIETGEYSSNVINANGFTRNDGNYCAPYQGGFIVVGGYSPTNKTLSFVDAGFNITSQLTLDSDASGIESVHIHKDKIFVVGSAANKLFYVNTETNEFVELLSATNFPLIAGYGDYLYVAQSEGQSGSQKNYKVNIDTLEVTDITDSQEIELTYETNTDLVYSGHFSSNGKEFYAYERGTGEKRTIASIDQDWKGYGFITLGNCRPLEILNRDSIAKISADVTLTQKGAAVECSGELIKMVFELIAAKFGGTVPVDYLDYVYGIEGAGLSTYSGDESFKRVGIADNFTALSPTGLTLYFSKKVL